MNGFQGKSRDYKGWCLLDSCGKVQQRSILLSLTKEHLRGPLGGPSDSNQTTLQPPVCPHMCSPVLWRTGHLRGPGCEGQVALGVSFNLESSTALRKPILTHTCCKAGVL